MSGGIAYILDEAGDFASRCNTQMVGLEELDDRDVSSLLTMIQAHSRTTGSERAGAILADWNGFLPKFVKVMPKDYKRVLQALEKAQAAGLTGDEALAAAFEENSHDAARLGGS
jgi:glutamate synthase (ferredoxin)